MRGLHVGDGFLSFGGRAGAEGGDEWVRISVWDRSLEREMLTPCRPLRREERVAERSRGRCPGSSPPKKDSLRISLWNVIPLMLHAPPFQATSYKLQAPGTHAIATGDESDLASEIWNLLDGERHRAYALSALVWNLEMVNLCSCDLYVIC